MNEKSKNEKYFYMVMEEVLRKKDAACNETTTKIQTLRQHSRGMGSK